MSDSSMAVDVVAYLDAQLGGLVTGTNLFQGWFPPSPDSCVSVRDIPGPADEYVMGKDSPPAIEILNVQVLVRASSYAAGWALMRQAHDLLRNFSGSMNGVAYAHVRERYGPGFIGKDENNRSQFSGNYQGMRRP